MMMKIEQILKKIPDTEKIIKIFSIIGSIGPILYIVVNQVVNQVVNRVYQSKCQQFYGVSGEYFSLSTINYLLSFGLLILFFIILFISINRSKRMQSSRMDKLFNIFVVICCGMSFSMLNLIMVFKIVDNYTMVNMPSLISFLNSYPMFSLWLIVLSPIVLLLCILFIKKIAKKRKLIQWLYIVVLLASLAVTTIIFFSGTGVIFSLSPETKRNYEIIESEKLIILAKYDNKLLVANYQEKDEEYTIYSKDYKFIDPYDNNFTFIQMQEKPKISNQSLTDNIN